MRVHVFAGPTLPTARVRELVPGAVCHPPVRHGDLLRLDTAPGDTVVVIDGLWHQSAPVRHKEILLLLAEGVRVVGAASMGALRAAELAPYGMTGVGQIFDQLRTGVLDADDEVAVLHTPDGRPLAEALVNLRTAFTRCSAAALISTDDARNLEYLARALPYTRRSWAALGRGARAAGATEAFETVDAWRRTHPYDLKREDAELALALVAAGLAPVTGAGPWAQEPWRTSFVRYWAATFRPDAAAVPFLAVLQHQQLYDPRFAARWRARVLAAVARRPPTRATPDLESAALRVAAAEGVDTAGMSGRQLAFWLTPEEIRDLVPAESLLRMMVRSARLDGAWSAWPSTRAEAGELLEAGLATTEAVAAAFALNAAVEAADARRSTAHLDPDRIARHLAARWHLAADADRAVLDAAARDRAFRDFAGAVEVARAFYLGARAAETSSPPVAVASSSVVRESQRT
ncbi:TfuA-like protein [Kitasatospora sp. NBC_00374]|uniref:TfuA-like protein n=1 Tax=Kitasatospora sp. NBC_00374 TaxID=2975964 RepID=UPI0030DFD16A